MKWRLNANPNKTEVCAFHLSNEQTNKKLMVYLEGIKPNYNLIPKYLRVTLDRSLTHKNHMEKPKLRLDRE